MAEEYPLLYEHMAQYTYYSDTIRFLVRFVRNLVSHKRHIRNSMAAAAASTSGPAAGQALHGGHPSSPSTAAGGSPPAEVGSGAYVGAGAVTALRHGEPVDWVLRLFPALGVACYRVVKRWCADDVFLRHYFC